MLRFKLYSSLLTFAILRVLACSNSQVRVVQNSQKM